jgi:hypothetical protein
VAKRRIIHLRQQPHCQLRLIEARQGQQEEFGTPNAYRSELRKRRIKSQKKEKKKVKGVVKL